MEREMKKIIFNGKEYWVLELSIYGDLPGQTATEYYLIPAHIKPQDLDVKTITKDFSSGHACSAHRYLKELGAISLRDLAYEGISNDGFKSEKEKEREERWRLCQEYYEETGMYDPYYCWEFY